MADVVGLVRSSAASIGGQAYAAIGPRLEAGQGQLALEAVAAARTGLDVLERQAVAVAREQGRSWADVGAALGISKQAAQQRFGATSDDGGASPGGAQASTLPELDVARVRRWCAARVPEQVAHQVRVECEVAPRHLTIVERRAPATEQLGPEWTSFPIAQLRYTKTRGRTWSLYWRDRNQRFHSYDEQFAPTPDVEAVLAEVERDPTSIFWG